VRRLGSAALDLCYVAAGRFDGYWEMDISPWDVAAGWLVAEEAGAHVTRYDGQPFSLTPPLTILAANDQIHNLIKTVLLA
jgi:myo-inositol-1(or 4)-monophosphatase